MTVTLRRASPHDLPALVTIKRDAGLAAWPHILPSDVIAGLPFPDRWVAAIDSIDPRTAVLVAETDGAPAAFAIIRPSDDYDAADETGELDGFYAAPAVWRAGIGRALLRAAELALAEHGFKVATLWTAAENHRPRRIYEVAGWVLDGVTRDRSLGGVDFSELRYRRELEPRPPASPT